jgi:L-threonylcarbamoyladenylate synthase
VLNTIISTDSDLAAQFLLNGETVAIPTETVYGLAANALDPEAVTRIFEAKMRPLFDPLIVHLHSADQMDLYADHISDKARILSEKFWPGPLTIVVKRNHKIPDLVTSGMDSVGLRVPNHPLALELLRSLPFPLAAPSANPFGYISPTSARHVYDQLKGRIPLILDGGSCQIGVESTIVNCIGDEVEILRLGGIPVADIQNAIGHVKVRQQSTDNPSSLPAPGMLVSHYSPRKKMVIGRIDKILTEHAHLSCGVLSFKTSYDVPVKRILSPAGDMRIAAQNLFGMMRELDASEIDLIVAELVPEDGLGLAINDRLKRAAAKD